MQKFSKILLFIFAFGFATYAYADNFTILNPIAGQVFNEGDVLYVHWSGNTIGSNSTYYGSSINSNIVSTVYLSISTSGSYGSASFDIGAADTASTAAFRWTVPKGIVSYFGGASQYVIKATGGGQTYYSPVFTVNGSTATPAMTVNKVYQSADMQCRASNTTVALGNPVTYSATTNMGTSPYIYRWSGNVPNLNSPSTSVIYPALGVYKAALNVTDKNYDLWYANCDDVNVVPPSSNLLFTQTNQSFGGSVSSSGAISYDANGRLINPGGVAFNSTTTNTTSYTTYTYSYTPPKPWSFAVGTSTSASSTPSTTKSASSTLPISATATSTFGCSALKQDLYVGVEGASSDVSSLQKYLSAIGDFSYSATGFFGLRTESAVKKFQGDQGISSTGYAGPITRAKIATLTCAN